MALPMQTRQLSSPFTLPQTQRAVSPMARMATGAMTPGAPNQRLGSGVGTNPMSNQFNYTPEQYSQGVESSYGDQLSQNAKDASAAQGTAQDYSNSLQRRNASNAAMGGYSVGGGGFLAGQTNALLGGQANASQLALQYSDRATGIRQNQATYEAGVDQRNTQNRNQYAYNDWTYNRGRTDTLADKKTDADATAFGGQVTSAVNAATASLGQYGVSYADGKGSGVGWAQVAPILDAMRNAQTPQALAAAKAQLDSWMASRGAARNAYQNPTPSNYYANKRYDNEDDYLKHNGYGAGS